MNTLQRTALTFVTMWVLFDAFAPGAPYNQRLQLCLIVTFGIGYLYGLHREAFYTFKRLFRKN